MATIPTEITVPVSTVPSDTLYLRELWASATADDGTKIELDRAGSTLLLTLTKPGGEKIRQKLSIEDLVTVWTSVWNVA